MALTVVKLGSTLVADDRGRRASRRPAARSAARSARSTRRATRRRSSPRARSRSGCAGWGWPCAPARSRSCRPRRRSGRGRCTTCMPELLAEHGVKAAQVLLTFFDIVGARAVRERAAHAREAPRVGRRADHQRERHHRDRRDQLRRQRHPRGAGRDPDVRRPGGRALRRGRPVHERPGAATRPRSSSPRCATLAELRDYEIGMSRSHIGSGGMRSKVLCAEMATSAGIPVVICNGTEPGTLLRAACGEPVGTRFHPAGAARVELQAVAEVREERRRRRCWSTQARSARCASRAPACCRSGWSRWTATSRPGMPWRWPRRATGGARSARGSRTTRPRSYAG